jgi:putative transposase
MKYAFIEDQRGRHAVATMCRVLEVSSSGYYAWRKRRTGGKRERSDRLVLQAIGQAYQASQGRYGSRRIRAGLARKGRFAAAGGWRTFAWRTDLRQHVNSFNNS